MNIVIIQPPGNPHYRVFDEILQMLEFELRSIGVESRIVANKLYPGEPSILVGWHLLSETQLRGLPNNVIVYNFEPLWSKYSAYLSKISSLPSGVTFWDYDQFNVELIRKTFHNVNVLHAPLGFSESLVQDSKGTRCEHDVLFYGSLNERRLSIIRQLELHNVRTKVLFNVYSLERDIEIKASRIVLNIHYGSPLLESPRLYPLWANKVPVVSELALPLSTPLHLREKPGFVPYSQIVQECLSLLNDAGKIERQVNNIYDTIKGHPYRESLEANVSLFLTSHV